MRFRSRKQMAWYLAGAFMLAVVISVGASLGPIRALQSLTDGTVQVLYHLTTKTRGWFSNEITADQVLGDEQRTRIALLEADNAALRRQLQYPDRVQRRTLGADVIAKSIDTAQQILIINRGSRDGVSSGQVVIADSGLYVGNIVRVELTRSAVRLPTDRRSRLGALLAKNSRPVGIVEGGYGIGMRLTLIPPQEVIEVGDIVVTSEATEYMPRGLLIGRVSVVRGERFEPFQHAVLDPIIPYEQIQSVLVVTAK